ncbi:tRNA-dihydrouridine synthase 3 [Bachmanniomyces sp. S44760]|nr:tRNA-dihydrouridine synthase 3 [Bachmanniomyces sp. S44760]
MGEENGVTIPPANPLEPGQDLRATTAVVDGEIPHPSQPVLEEDSAVTRAEKIERHVLLDDTVGPPTKRLKIDQLDGSTENGGLTKSERIKGVASIKPEFLVHAPRGEGDRSSAVINDDAAEAHDSRAQGSRKSDGKGQNTARHFGSSRDEKGLCASRALSNEFSPTECRFGEKCKFEHDLRKYIKQWKREDLTTFDGICPVWSIKGKCDAGWKCRFVGSHMEERDTTDGKNELVLLQNESTEESPGPTKFNATGIVNVASTEAKMDLARKRVKTPKSDAYVEWLEKNAKEIENYHKSNQRDGFGSEDEGTDGVNDKNAVEDNRARYSEPPFLASEKRRIYFGPETPVLAPLTTQGNLPFRRLCVSLGAQITYSEMAMSLPLIQGNKSEWALMKAHQSETTPPSYRGPGHTGTNTVLDYDNSKDFKFGAQIAANKPWQALKATEILTQLCPRLRVIDVNCGCPIDLVYRQGAGSALLDNQSKLEKIIKGMNAVSGEIPITAKIRMGTKDGKPTALKLVNRLVYGGYTGDTSAIAEGGASSASGVAALTLHGRSRQQRYTRNADWSYISECAALIKSYNDEGDSLTDTIRDPDPRHQAPSSGEKKVFFLGNGDCYSHQDYNNHLENAGIDSVMIARGALIKPWIFEEISSNQYLDKSATERLGLVEQFVRFGLETWGSDEMGVGTTRRFLLEWLSFAYRYVPVAMLEFLPPSLQDRPPAWKGRNELETLLGSDNYKDWIKISEMFLGPAHGDFKFQPKHKSNSYEIEAEG